MAKDAIIKIRQLEAEKSRLIEKAKSEAIEKADAAIAELSELGFSYKLVADGQKATTAIKETKEKTNSNGQALLHLRHSDSAISRCAAAQISG